MSRRNDNGLLLYHINPPINMKLNKKINNDDFFIPDYNNFLTLCNYNYKVPQLKIICKHYKLKVSGTKDELNYKIYN